MPAEIERKFLVDSDDWKLGVIQIEHLRDGLIARFDGGKVRVRQAAQRAWITVKGPREGLARPEFEYEIPVADAEVMLRTLCQGPIVEKVRYCVPHADRIWAVDIHRGLLEGLTLVEVELDAEDERLDVPSWVGREVTGDPLYSKAALIEAALTKAAHR